MPMRRTRPRVVDHVDTGEFGFFAAVVPVGRQFEGLAGGAKHRAVALEEPLRRHADGACGRPAAVEPVAEHPHAVGQLGVVLAMHRLAMRGAAQMGQTGPRDQAARWFGMIDRGTAVATATRQHRRRRTADDPASGAPRSVRPACARTPWRRRRGHRSTRPPPAGADAAHRRRRRAARCRGESGRVGSRPAFYTAASDLV